MSDVEILDLPPHRVAALPHRGAYPAVGPVFKELSDLATTRGLWPISRGLVMVACDDPDTVPEADLRSYAGILVPEDLALEPPLEEITLPPGRHAVMQYVGPYEGLRDAWGQLYGAWMACSGETPGPGWSFEIYRNTPLDVPPEALRTDLYAPLA